MIELEVTIPSTDALLSGTMCLPHEAGRFPTALWLQGSGPIDRNDNVAGQELNNAKAVAHYLADLGIATLRYDKRGVGKSTGEYLAAGHSDLVEDGLKVLQFLSSSAYCDSSLLFAIGHSEGAIIAPQLAQQFGDVAGIVLLCPAIEEPESVLMRQARQLEQMISAQSWLKQPLAKLYMAVINPVKSQRKFIARAKNTTARTSRLGLSKQPLHWFRQFLELDLAEIYRKTKCPTLAIAGSKDIQCLPSDAIEIADAIQGEYEYHVVKDMSHFLRNEPNEACIFNYAAQLKQPIEPIVLELIGKWIQQKTSQSLN